jgi:hypothetical protein
MNNTCALIACFCLLFIVPLRAQEGNALFDPSYVHELHFTFFQDNFFEEMDSLWVADHDASGTNVPSMKALLEIDGQFLDTIGIRIKGLSSYYKANDKKKPFKVDLNEFISGNKYDGMKKFNLHNGACDPSLMRDFLSYDILRTAGVRAPRTSHCKVYFNGEYWGVYSIIEQIDKAFLKNNFADDDGTLIKNTGWDELKWKGSTITPYLEDYELRTNEDVEDWGDFLNFMNVLNNSTDAEFAAAIQQAFDVDLYLHVMAVDVMTNNWDSYIDGERNYYLYHEPSSKQFHWIPWDYNLSLGGALSVKGNPYPPFDSACYIQANFSEVHLGNSIQFTNESVPSVDNVLWDFGDGTTSTTLNPEHVYSVTGKVNVCLTAYRMDAAQLCQNTRCKEIDLDFMPQACNTILNGSCPHPATDPFFQMVVQQDNYCCEGQWDALCSLQWFELSQSAQNNNIGSPGVPYSLNYPLIITDTNKVLIRRLMKVPEFRKRYLDICCVMLENNFNKERLFPIIDEQANLIRPYIKEDSNYIFSPDYFEYDVGDGSGGGGEATIPALKWILQRRFDQLSSNMLSIGHDCGGAFSTIGWHDLVINEFSASNAADGGVPDANGEYGDWIEIYNNTNEIIQLDYFYLSDSPKRPFKWTFPFGSYIEPHGYFMVWADKDEYQPGVHTNFNLSSSGESLILMHEDRTVIDSFSYGAQITNLPSARKPNGTGNFVAQPHTFASNNNLVNLANDNPIDAIFRIYPNPANEQLVVELDETFMHNKRIEINLFDALGKSVSINSKIESHKFLLSTASLCTGYYYLKIKLEGYGFIMKKVAIIH